MNLTFSQGADTAYTAEFKLTADSNVHIEGAQGERIRVYQRGTSSGQYVPVKILDIYKGAVDFDMTALVYPKWVMIASMEPVESGVVTGGVESV